MLGELLFFAVTSSSGDLRASRGFCERLKLAVLVRPWHGDEALDRDSFLKPEEKRC